MIAHAPHAVRVLVLAPPGRDGVNSTVVLHRAGIASVCCKDIDELCERIDEGVGAVMLTEEALAQDRAGRLPALLAAQPRWSDLPFVFLARGGPDSAAGLRAMAQLGNVVLLERPVRVSTMVTAVRTALRGRSRQYQIRDLLDDLRDADRRKDEFLAMLAHELRNPLAPVRNATDVLGMVSHVDSRLTNVAAVLDRQVTNLSRLVDDLLDVSRITRGKITLRNERAVVADIISRAVETSQPLIQQFRHELAIDLPASPVTVEWDGMRICQVVSNLLNNAAKYTPPGGRIRLTVTRGDDGVQIVVRDNGIGISLEQQEHVFDLFMQADHAAERTRGGLGIGLTLARSIVRMHGGEIAVASDGPGRGSVFTIRMPLVGVTSSDELAPSTRFGPQPDPARPARLHS